jgi:putative hydrolase of the HAD superfamily
MIKAIIFDLWDTLIPATIDMRHLHSLIKKSGYSFDEFVPRYEQAVQLKKYSNFSELHADFIKAFKHTPEELLEEQLYELWFNRVDKIHLFVDVEKNLVKLRKEGYKLALLSNTENLVMPKILSLTHIDKHLDLLCPSFETGYLKPDKKAFELVLNKLGVTPKDALMIGDSLRADIRGAQGVGLHNCLINRSNKIVNTQIANPEFVIKSFDEIFRVLGVLNKE